MNNEASQEKQKTFFSGLIKNNYSCCCFADYNIIQQTDRPYLCKKCSSNQKNIIARSTIIKIIEAQRKKLEEEGKKVLMSEPGINFVTQDQCKEILKDDPVNNPAHYKGIGMQAIDVIEAFSLSFCAGNAVKYLLRAGKKGSRVECLKKAIWYINRIISESEKVTGEKLSV